jgi:hypothetical protein
MTSAWAPISTVPNGSGSGWLIYTPCMDEYDDDDFDQALWALRMTGTRALSALELPVVATVDLSDLPVLGNGESFTITTTEP